MNIHLTPELEEFVKEKLESGLYSSASEVIREGLRLLEERERLKISRYEDLKQEIALGLEQLEAGKVKPFDPERVKEKVRKKAAKRRKAT